jgi:hypothetical protein
MIWSPMTFRGEIGYLEPVNSGQNLVDATNAEQPVTASDDADQQHNSLIPGELEEEAQHGKDYADPHSWETGVDLAVGLVRHELCLEQELRGVRLWA